MTLRSGRCGRRSGGLDGWQPEEAPRRMARDRRRRGSGGTSRLTVVREQGGNDVGDGRRNVAHSSGWQRL
jgi:hypothetical protein